MKKSIITIQSKLNYWKGQETKFADRYLEDNTRRSRDSWMRVKEKCKTFTECLEICKTEE